MADIRVYPYYSPRIIEVLSPDTEISIQELHDKIRDWEDGDDTSTFEEIIDSAGKEALGGGVYVGITSTLQDAYVMFTGRTTPLETGTCTTGDSNGTTLYATGGQFEINNVVPGDTVMNYTTKALATVINVVSDIELQMLQLSGGSRATWVVDDEYIVWRNQQCSISGGNLVAVDSGGSDMSCVLPSPNVQIVRTASSSATLQELQDIQFASFIGGQAYLDPVNGDDENKGNAEYPVKTLGRAKEVLLARGLSRIKVIGSLILEATDDVRNIFLNGEAPNKSYVFVTDGCLTDQVHFNDITVQGVLTGTDADFCNCYIDGVTNVVGIAQNSWLTGTITLGGTSSDIVTFTNCYLGTTAVGLVVIDMNGDGPALAMRPYTGGVKITNKSGNAKVAIDFHSGRLELTNTVTAGTFFVRGVGEITSNEATGITLNDDPLINSAVVADATWDEDRIDHTGAGTFGAVDEWAGEVDESAIAEAVDTQLSDSHGSGSWEGSGDPATIAAAVWNAVRTLYDTEGTFGATDEWASAIDGPAIAGAVWDANKDNYNDPDTMGELQNTGGSGGGLDADAVASAVWDAIANQYGTPGTMGWLQNLIQAGLISSPRIIPGE